MKKSIVYPDWVEKYRTKGRTIRKVRDGYGLYECTSVYVKGQKYPKSVQKYLGMITEKDGFIPKNPVNSTDPFIEYGLSHFILANFKRDLERSVYNASSEIIRLGIIFFMFGSIDPSLIASTYLSCNCLERLSERAAGGVSVTRLKSVSNKIGSLLEEHIPDERDRLVLVRLLSLAVVRKDGNPGKVIYPGEAQKIAERYGLKL